MLDDLVDTRNIYKIILRVEGFFEILVMADDDESAIEAAKARTANIERHLNERLSTTLDVYYDFISLELFDTVEGEPDGED